MSSALLLFKYNVICLYHDPATGIFSFFLPSRWFNCIDLGLRRCEKDNQI